MRLESATRKRSTPALTALVDIVFILLFFFMLAARTAPPRALELRVEAPSPGAAAGAADVPEAIVRSGGRVDYDGRELAAGELADRLSGAGVARLSVRADGGARLQDLVTVLDVLRRADVAVQLLPGAP